MQCRHFAHALQQLRMPARSHCGGGCGRRGQLGGAREPRRGCERVSRSFAVALPRRHSPSSYVDRRFNGADMSCRNVVVSLPGVPSAEARQLIHPSACIEFSPYFRTWKMSVAAITVLPVTSVLLIVAFLLDAGTLKMPNQGGRVGDDGDAPRRCKMENQRWPQ